LFDLKEHNNISDIIELEDAKSLITIIDESKIEKSLHDTSSTNISIALASAVTAYGRIFMSKVKIKYKDSLFYSDTDSIFLNCDLDFGFIDSGLGQWKKEYDFKEGIFICPKSIWR
jgi:hypothetical protein